MNFVEKKHIYATNITVNKDILCKLNKNFKIAKNNFSKIRVDPIFLNV